MFHKMNDTFRTCDITHIHPGSVSAFLKERSVFFEGTGIKAVTKWVVENGTHVLKTEMVGPKEGFVKYYTRMSQMEDVGLFWRVNELARALRILIL